MKARKPCRRWVAVCADLIDHPVVGVSNRRKGGFTKTEAWLWLIIHAAYKTHPVGTKGKTMQLERGQLPVGRDYLAKEWGWGTQKVRTYLNQLCSENMAQITHPNKQAPYILTLCNYDQIQNGIAATTQENNPVINQQITSKQPHSTKDTKDTKESPPSPQRGENDRGRTVSALKTAPDPKRYRRDPFELRPDFAEEEEQAGIRYNQDGNLEAFNGTKVAMLKELGGDEEQLRLDLLAIQASNKVGPSMSPLMLKSKAMGALGELVGRRRDQDRRYAQAATNKRAGGAAAPPKSTLSIDQLPPTADPGEIRRRFDSYLRESPSGRDRMERLGREEAFAIFSEVQLKRAERAGVRQ